MNSLLQVEWMDLKQAFPHFSKAEEKDDGCTITGLLPIVDVNGLCWETYQVKIVMSNQFPDVLPAVWETGGQIDRSIEWHINGDGSCCVGTLARQYFLLNGEISLKNWVYKLVIPYLANHTLKKKTGAYSNGERSHDWKALLEEYQELFPEHGSMPLLQHMKYVTGTSTLGRNALCFCGSLKKYKYCFLREPHLHRKNIPLLVILNDISILKSKITQ